MAKKKLVIMVVGATGSGKSAVAHQIAKKFGGYLIAADSRQVYRGLDIGTNKDPGQWVDVRGKKVFMVDGVEEYLVDWLAPDQEFTLVDWLAAVKKQIQSDSRLPVIVGGTGLYTTALAQGFTPGGTDVELREKLNNLTIEKLAARLKKQDPAAAAKVDLKNKVRVIRALEMCLLNKKSGRQPPEYDILQLGIKIPREQLYQKINRRVDEMIDQGLAAEVKALLEQGYDRQLPALTGIGYRQMIQYLDNEITLPQAIELIKRDTRRYAKRQMAWFQRDKSIVWVAFDPFQPLSFLEGVDRGNMIA